MDFQKIDQSVCLEVNKKKKLFIFITMVGWAVWL